MDELLLHFLWQYQKFTTNHLQLTDGRALLVFDPGHHNEDAGPDFSEARIKIEALQWVGSVEIHIRSSDWNRHGHQNDRNYDVVVLHVVWKADQEVFIDDHPIPMLELQHVVDPILLRKYNNQLTCKQRIPCASQIHSVDAVYIRAMLDRTGTERLQRKADYFLHKLAQEQGDWEAVTYQALGLNFGFATNKAAFEKLTQILPYQILKKEQANLKSVRALIIGQAGLLDQTKDQEAVELRKEYNYLKKKYKLSTALEMIQWKFGKLRPANAPIQRVEQLAHLMHAQLRLFSQFLLTDDANELISLFRNLPDSNEKSLPALGRSSAENIIINTVAPLLTAYATYVKDDNYLEQAVKLLEQLKPENNRITRHWKSDDKPQSAFDSQAQMELITNYCFKRRCLRCSIGVKILNT